MFSRRREYLEAMCLEQELLHNEAEPEVPTRLYTGGHCYAQEKQMIYGSLAPFTGSRNFNGLGMGCQRKNCPLHLVFLAVGNGSEVENYTIIHDPGNHRRVRKA